MNTTTVAETMAANLRAAADLIAQHPHLAAPYVTTSSTGRVDLDWYLSHKADGRSIAAEIVRSIDGGWERGEADFSGPLATWTQKRDGLTLMVSVSREQVCERIVTGTETVTIPAVEAVPERTEIRETVEWRCAPLLTDAPTEAVSA